MDFINLAELPDNKFVIHYGGKLNEVNAYTLSNSLICISNLIDEINQRLNPDFAIEVRVEAIGIGSFRPTIKLVRKHLATVFKGVIKKEQIIPILISLMTLKQAGGPTKLEVILKGEEVTISRETMTIVMPKIVYDNSVKIYGDVNIQKNIAQNFAVLDGDQNITVFGFAEDAKSPNLVFNSSKDDFFEMAQIEPVKPEENAKIFSDRTKIQIIRPILEKRKRRWEFVWRGVRVSGYIEDQAFFDSIGKGLKLGIGDQIEVTIEIRQIKDPSTDAWINETYTIKEYHDYYPARIGKQAELPIE
jgi:hypothetical protein